jgi:competence protein ComEC
LVETTQTAEADRVFVRPALERSGVPVVIPSTSTKPRWPGLVASVGTALEQRRLFVLLPFAAIAGLIASLASEASPELWAVAAVALALAMVLVLLRTSTIGFRIALLIAAFWAGFGLLQVHGLLFGTEMLSRAAYGTFEARVDEIVSETESGKRVILSQIVPGADARAVPMRRARIVIDGGPDLSPGDIIRAPIRFYPVPGPVIPGGHDTQFHSYFDGVGAYGSATGTAELLRQGDSRPERLIDAVRQGIAGRIDQELAQPAAGIARAIINGDQSAVTDEAREVMATAGLAHVLSISGLHLTLVAGGAYFVLRLLLSLSYGLSRRVSVKRVAAIGGIVAALAYFAISGGNVAALRSTIMIVLVFGAVIFGRRALTMRNVAIAGLLVIGSDPASVFRPSFQLSFAAVVALVGAFEMIRSERKDQAGFASVAWRYLAGITVTSLVAGLATVLFSIYHFQQTSPLGLLGNLVILPLVSFVTMPAAAAAALLMPFGLEQPFLTTMGWSIDRMLDLAGVITGLSGNIDASPLLTPMALLLGLGALCWFAFFQNWYRLIGPALLAPAVLLFALDQPPDVLIADTTQAVAMRVAEGLGLIDGKPDSFAVDVWRETYGEGFAAAPVRCDAVACLAESSARFKVALVEDPAGFYEECGNADLVITRRDAPQSCAAGTVIDADDLKERGVHWLRWTGDGFEIRPAIVGLRRPWRAAR